jgi:ankyrin repeat protein
MSEQPAADEMVASAHSDLGRVRELADRDPELVRARATWGETPLQAAAQMGHREILRLLLERGAPLDVHAAAALGDAEAVREMLNQDPSLANREGPHGLPMMYFAAVGGSVGVAELLLRNGTEVNAVQAGGHGPLHGAAMLGHVRMARWLLDHGADPLQPGYEGRTPVELARRAGHEELARLLEEAAG